MLGFSQNVRLNRIPSAFYVHEKDGFDVNKLTKQCRVGNKDLLKMNLIKFCLCVSILSRRKHTH